MYLHEERPSQLLTVGHVVVQRAAAAGILALHKISCFAEWRCEALAEPV